MGIYLSRPLTTKDNDIRENDQLAACSTEMQGWRIYMEDAHILNLDGEINDVALMGVFDGHGGPAVSKWVSQHFIDTFGKELESNQTLLGTDQLDHRSARESLPSDKVALLAHSLEKTFLNVDEQLKSQDSKLETELRVIQNTSMRIRKREMAINNVEESTSTRFFKDLVDGKKWKANSECPNVKREMFEDEGLTFSEIQDAERTKDINTPEMERTGFGEPFNQPADVQEKRNPFDPQSCGCTAVVAALCRDPCPVLVVANAGDSRCVLSRNGVAIPMTVDHKPMQERELDRIREAGGYVVNGRVDSNLNLSRSLGDLHYKRNNELPPEAQRITAMPDVTYLDLCQDDDFVILCCDGIWDILSEQQCVTRVHSGWDALKKEDAASGSSRSDSELCSILASQLCDACLAPSPFDPDSAGAGCDNMTAMVIRVRDEWRKTFPEIGVVSDQPRLYGNEQEQINYKKTRIMSPAMGQP